MKLSEKPAEKSVIGCFITFGSSPTDKVDVVVDNETSYRSKVTISFPQNYEGNRYGIVLTALKHIYRGGLIPVRLEYENVRNVLSMEEITVMEYMLKYYTFHVYGVPKDMVQPQFSKLDLEKIRNKIRRQEDRERRLRKKLQAASSVKE